MSSQKKLSEPGLISHIKNEAKKIKKASGIQHSKALDQAAQNAGFHNYMDAYHQLTKN